MDITPHPITIREVVENYVDDGEGGVFGLGGRLNIRPPYQREFVYKEDKRNAVIGTIFDGFPLNVFYWVENDDGKFEILDGQQRTISFSQFAAGHFSMNINGNLKNFSNLTQDEKDKFYDYELLVYRCKGTDSEKLSWFRTINIAGEKLTDQELLNATYYGPWLNHAKQIFSRTGGAAWGLGEPYLKGQPIRQDFLETALKWISARDGFDHHKAYMAEHQHDPNANELWSYFRAALHWVEDTFPKTRVSLMRGLPWGPLYDTYGKETFDTDALEAEISALIQDDDVVRKKGIYQYVLDRDPKHLNIRAFSDDQRRTIFEHQDGRCASGTKCKDPENADGKKVFALGDMDADHIVPWSKGGKTDTANGQMLCVSCNRSKGDL